MWNFSGRESDFSDAPWTGIGDALSDKYPDYIKENMGVMTANEIRAAENLPPLPGGDNLTNPFTTSNTAPAGNQT